MASAAAWLGDRRMRALRALHRSAYHMPASDPARHLVWSPPKPGPASQNISEFELPQISPHVLQGATCRAGSSFNVAERQTHRLCSMAWRPDCASRVVLGPDRGLTDSCSGRRAPPHSAVLMPQRGDMPAAQPLSGVEQALCCPLQRRSRGRRKSRLNLIKSDPPQQHCSAVGCGGITPSLAACNFAPAARLSAEHCPLSLGRAQPIPEKNLMGVLALCHYSAQAAAGPAPDRRGKEPAGHSPGRRCSAAQPEHVGGEPFPQPGCRSPAPTARPQPWFWPAVKDTGVLGGRMKRWGQAAVTRSQHGRGARLNIPPAKSGWLFDPPIPTLNTPPCTARSPAARNAVSCWMPAQRAAWSVQPGFFAVLEQPLSRPMWLPRFRAGWHLSCAALCLL